VGDSVATQGEHETGSNDLLLINTHRHITVTTIRTMNSTTDCRLESLASWLLLSNCRVLTARMLEWSSSSLA